MAAVKYECATCKSDPIKKEDNFVSIGKDSKGANIQGIRNIVDCNNVRFYNNQVMCRTCNAIVYEDIK